MLITFADGVFDCADAWSRKDFTGNSRVAVPDGVIVYQTCFSQETPDSHIFRPAMTGVTFRNCNLDNVFVPNGNTVMPGCSTRRFALQNDLRDWEINASGVPIRVLNERYWQQQGFAVDPALIPPQFQRVEVMLKADWIARQANILPWFITAPTVVEDVRMVRQDIPIWAWQTMLTSGVFYPFDSKPQNQLSAVAGVMSIRGQVTYVTISGPGLIELNGVRRRFDTDITTLLVRT